MDGFVFFTGKKGKGKSYLAVSNFISGIAEIVIRYPIKGEKEF